MSEKQAHLNGAYYGPSIPPKRDSYQSVGRSGSSFMSPRPRSHNSTSGSNSTLYYNLSLNLTIRNPNKKLGIYYDSIEAGANYEGQRFSTKTLTPFYQGHKTTNVLNPVFSGQQLLVGSNLQSEYDQQTTAGVYNIQMKLYLRIRFKFGRIKTGKFKPRVKCDLDVPLSKNGNSATTFQTTRCKIDYFN
ncbi:hypothetical protein M0R45_029943 [Rubus argutus]|uniref:Late embryogenesis abundant protein LEA-2 subgroup domain-containing protein n=1 Tax=Rubus argutus TaxID=59490 RepID=A0AAW1WD46_RUBAR